MLSLSRFLQCTFPVLESCYRDMQESKFDAPVIFVVLELHSAIIQISIQGHDWLWVPKTTAYKRWNCQVTRPANCCHLIPSNRFLDGFPVPSQFAAAKLTHYSTMPHRPSDSSRPRQRLLLSGDVHQNPGPATKYPCSVCTSNVTSRGVSYMCNRCSGWVHSKCSGLQNAAEYRRIKNWDASLAVPHPLHKYRNRFHHQLHQKLPMGIPSPFCNSTQMASATNRLN